MNRVAALAVILVVSIGGGLLAAHLQFRSYWRRACTGRAWKLGYPEASKAQIREFLKLFVRAFGFRRSRMFRFEPTDQVKDILSKRFPLISHKIRSSWKGLFGWQESGTVSI